MIAFLIDADNFSAPAWIDEAMEKIGQAEGAIAIRRAYGSAENLRGLADTLGTWAIRPFANLSLSKNTTDMSLAVDAMELACTAPGLRLVVIGSGDMDFVPLVVRLRERGIKVVCASERSKMAQEAVRAYDGVIHVGASGRAPAAPAPAGKTARTASRTRGAAKAVAVKEAPAPAKRAAPARAPARKTAAQGTQDAVARMLAAAPQLQDGEWHRLDDLAKLLRERGLLAKSASSTTLFKKSPDAFELDAQRQPNRVRYTGPRL